MSSTLPNVLCGPGLTSRHTGLTQKMEPDPDRRRKNGGIIHLEPFMIKYETHSFSRKMVKRQFTKALKG